VRPLVIAFRDGPLHQAYESAGIPVRIVPVEVGRLSTADQLADSSHRLHIAVKQHFADVVFANTLLTFPAILAAKHARLPSIWNPRETEDLRVYFRFVPNNVARQAIAAMQVPRKIVCVSGATPRSWHRLPRNDRLTVIPNAIDPKRFHGTLAANRCALRARFGWPADETVFLCVGTICPNKGQWDAVRAAWRVMRQGGPSLRVVFVGYPVGAYGKIVSWASRACARWPRRVRIECHGPSEYIGEYYAAADAILLCSRSESSSRTVLESLVFGLPLVATNVPGIRDQISWNDGPYLYSPGDVQTLSSHMHRLAVDVSERDRLAVSSRAQGAMMASRYSEMLDHYAQVIANVSGHSAPRPQTVQPQDA